MKGVKLYSYNPVSSSGRDLARGLGIKRIRHDNSKFVAKPSTTVINWGSSALPEALLKGQIIQDPDKVSSASNKLSFFRMNEGSEFVPDFTIDIDEAIEWCRDGSAVVCRTNLTGHSGEGIVIAETEEALVDAPLYVKYFKKKDEYRVHVFNDKVIDIQRKARRLGAENVNWRVRNHANGFIYARENVNPPPCVVSAAEESMKPLGLTFGAVDVLYNEHKDKAVVLEVNTAPGLTGTTLQNYLQAFKEIL